MREFKIFLVVVIFTGIVYWGVEPFAHSQMNPSVAPADFNYSKEDASYYKAKLAASKATVDALEAKLKTAKDKKIATNELEQAKKADASLKALVLKYEKLWLKADKIAALKGDAKAGKELFDGNCIACHGLKAVGVPDPVTDSSAFGVTPPDLSDAGNLFARAFLAAFIMDPAMAAKVTHKFNSNHPYPMPDYPLSDDKVKDNADIANILAYLDEVGKIHKAKFEKETKAKLMDKYKKDPNKDALIAKAFSFEKDKDAFINACGRCHSMKYDKFVPGANNIKDWAKLPAYKRLEFETVQNDNLKKYLGSVPPDLSMMIRSRGDKYLEIFINDPQKELAGTAMPRVGVNEASEAKIISYMSKVGDSKKEIRENLGVYIMIFFVILSVFAYGWKHQVWSKLH